MSDEELYFHDKPVKDMTREELVDALTVAAKLLDGEREDARRYRETMGKWGIYGRSDKKD